MVSSVFVRNHTDFSFNCFPVLDCEDEGFHEHEESYWINLRYHVKPKCTVRVADLTRDYFFKKGRCYYFSFYLFPTAESENLFAPKNIDGTHKPLTLEDIQPLIKRTLHSSGVECLVLKVKNFDSHVTKNLQFGAHSLPYGTISPAFAWMQSTSWSVSYFRSSDRIFVIKYRSIFSASDCNIEFVVESTITPEAACTFSKLAERFPAVARDSSIACTDEFYEYQKLKSPQDAQEHGPGPSIHKEIPTRLSYPPNPYWEWTSDWLFEGGSGTDEGGWAYKHWKGCVGWLPEKPLAFPQQRRRKWTRARRCRYGVNIIEQKPPNTKDLPLTAAQAFLSLGADHERVAIVSQSESFNHRTVAEVEELRGGKFLSCFDYESSAFEAVRRVIERSPSEAGRLVEQFTIFEYKRRILAAPRPAN